MFFEHTYSPHPLLYGHGLSYRSGTAMGASMGTKKLKAVAVRGTKPVKVYNPEKILEYNQQIIDLV